MRALTIAHVLTSLGVGGAERVVALLAAAQTELGHRVMVVSLEQPAEGSVAPEVEAAGASLVRLGKQHRGCDPLLTWRLARTFRRAGVDVVHTHNSLPLVYGAPAGRAAGARVVHTKHGAEPVHGRRLWLRRAGSLCTDAFVAVSEATARCAREQHEVPERRLHVIANATDLVRFAPDPERRREARARWGVDPSALVMGSVGRLAPVKDHALLVRAAAPLLGPRCKLVIAGDGSEMARVRRTIARLGVEPHVLMLGMVRDPSEVMVALDLFVLSSRSEGLPLSLCEAMASGLPVVATAVGGVPDVVDHGVTGYLVAPSDDEALRGALQRLLDNTSLRHEMGRTARRVAEQRYSQSRMAHEYLTLYDCA